MVGLSSRALSKITSSFMALTSDGQKCNLGLSLKFEAKGLKVIEYSRKDGRYWEFSEKALNLLREYKEKFPEVFRTLDKPGDAMAKSSSVFPGAARYLVCDQLKKETVKEIEALADRFGSNKSHTAIKKAIVKGIPRQAVLKPSHAIYRLQNQHFALGDRVTMVQDTGGVPLSIKGVVIGMNAKSMDIVWDAPFMSGTTLGDRCSQYRGSTVEFTTCLNLANPQFVASTNPQTPTQHQQRSPFKPRFGPYPAIQPAPGQQAASGFRPAAGSQGVPVHIMANPNRGRGGYVNGRGGPPVNKNAHPNGTSNGVVPDAATAPQTNGNHVDARQPPSARGNFAARGAPNGGPARGGYAPPFRGRGGLHRILIEVGVDREGVPGKRTE
ncbi:hypothetical protein A0H81_13718 [Grifola frondosa]|uniref:Uncharacterized protein n=1 Tax=Grifola frondosa TaxID=5627 RepID=A0A1C7LNK5_GRIFR|nr:hypothetical protein A0H81_13718 [Grifola frondosa]